MKKRQTIQDTWQDLRFEKKRVVLKTAKLKQGQKSPKKRHKKNGKNTTIASEILCYALICVGMGQNL